MQTFAHEFWRIYEKKSINLWQSVVNLQCNLTTSTFRPGETKRLATNPTLYIVMDAGVGQLAPFLQTPSNWLTDETIINQPKQYEQ